MRGGCRKSRRRRGRGVVAIAVEAMEEASASGRRTGRTQSGDAAERGRSRAHVVQEERGGSGWSSRRRRNQNRLPGPQAQEGRSARPQRHAVRPKGGAAVRGGRDGREPRPPGDAFELGVHSQRSGDLVLSPGTRDAWFSSAAGAHQARRSMKDTPFCSLPSDQKVSAMAVLALAVYPRKRAKKEVAESQESPPKSPGPR